jgi:Uma2 family endonuclease
MLLVCEITSPSNAMHDRVTKMHAYAAARVPWYLLIHPDGPTMRLYRLNGDTYVEHAAVEPGTALVFPDPIGVAVDPGTLVRDRG